MVVVTQGWTGTDKYVCYNYEYRQYHVTLMSTQRDLTSPRQYQVLGTRI